MTKHMRMLSWWIVVLVVSVSAVLLIVYRIGSGISFWAREFETAKTTTATVISVAPAQKRDSAVVSENAVPYRICYEIDNVDQIDSSLRRGYREAEFQRLSRDGPRCKVTSKTALARNIRQGDQLSIVYLLGNQNQIDVVTISALGEDL